MVSNYLYLVLNLGSLSIPLLYSIFEKEFHFIKYIKYAFLSILLIAIPFLIWDSFFTSTGVWGFNSDYHISLLILKMPLEEWMFFFCIPYACLFTHEVLKHYIPNFKLSKKASLWVSVALLTVISVLLLINFGKWYTTVNFIFFLVLLAYASKYHKEELRSYYPSFLVILIPFFVVNGILTGSFIEQPVVWYNNEENLGFRLFTIPFEDIFYAFNLLFSIQLVFNYLKNRNHAK
ncbi:lycopene cyclase domain-containing protein [Tenacibaculum sp. MAR_2009_124]|uniref:lycopene cyclase domain-containing protein n=1 Tax=Tenacibaculum sp. MAR_2009_124 TaxID=1250059 RepID=UPI000899DC9E|nr:lycopene cyclase domain-containing protein [Tenacibaculum sp. MAR_2009_124]SEB44018.1 lycopene cyclase domain-containing protein [Tenacibaculum sp. MAR_2009_124]